MITPVVLMRTGQFGGIAPNGRASVLQTEGCRFESVYLHKQLCIGGRDPDADLLGTKVYSHTAPG